MATQTIEVSESAYHTLLTQADRLQISPARLVEYLVENVPLSLTWEGETNVGHGQEKTNLDHGLAALDRLTTLFADLPLPNLETHLDDPMLTLANLELDHLLQ